MTTPTDTAAPADEHDERFDYSTPPPLLTYNLTLYPEPIVRPIISALESLLAAIRTGHVSAHDPVRQAAEAKACEALGKARGET